ncbi:MAG: hypothetical protein KUG70_07350, partial [Rhodobacteraceae bacterium]|nr:hypothetical protein [Paracoccaceae bacterium]
VEFGLRFESAEDDYDDGNDASIDLLPVNVDPVNVDPVNADPVNADSADEPEPNAETKKTDAEIVSLDSFRK